MSSGDKNLEDEANRATDLLKGKVVQQVFRHRTKEVGIQFTDGTTIFIDHQPTELDISIT
ncbi:hypothetical protein [Cognaticolwellia mytili]|uniref:hypothetical protein n=1 Tax=Cognaticolwellia mytili TaxID=1888913 RepID=UPI000A176105|nr:hypothetical protein [Cognaticolwellia mytili]